MAAAAATAADGSGGRGSEGPARRREGSRRYFFGFSLPRGNFKTTHDGGGAGLHNC